MAIQHLYTILCENLVVAQDGRPTAVNMFQNVEVLALPGGGSSIGILVGFRGDDGDQFRVTIEDPDNAVMGEVGMGTIEAPSALREHVQWATTVFGNMRPAVFRLEGVHRVQLWSGDELVHSSAFGVILAATRQEEDDGD